MPRAVFELSTPQPSVQDLRLRPRGHWDRIHGLLIYILYIAYLCFISICYTYYFTDGCE
jgi:hypothetical protein